MNLDKFTWYETDDALLMNPTTNKVLAIADAVKDATISNTADSTPVTGGAGLQTIFTIKSNKATKVTIANALFTTDLFEVKTGTTKATGAKEIVWYDDLKLNATKVATLTKKIYGDILDVHTLDVNGAKTGSLESTAYSITAQAVTITSGTEGDIVRIFYKTKTDAEAITLASEYDKFAKTVKLVLNGMVRNTNTEALMKAQFVAFKADLNDAFDFDVSNGKEPAPVSIEATVLKPNTGKVNWEMILFTESGIEVVA